MRRLSCLVLALLMLLAFAGPAAAGGGRPSEKLPLADFNGEFAPGEVCEFGVSIEYVAGTITYTDLTTQAGVYVERIWYRATARLTNVATGEWLEVVERSPTISRPRADGSVRVAAHGDFWWFYYEGEPSNLGAGLYFVEDGLAVDKFDAEGNLTSGHVAGAVTDLCAALS